MRRLLVACLLLGACGTGVQHESTINPPRTPTNPPRIHDESSLYLMNPPGNDAVLDPYAADQSTPADVTTTTTTTVPEPTTTTTEPPRPPVTAASRSRSTPNCGGWEAQVAEAGDWNVADVCSVMRCESTFDPAATNGRYRGLMQVDGGSLDGETNLGQAFALWNETRTWRRWTCKP